MANNNIFNSWGDLGDYLSENFDVVADESSQSHSSIGSRSIVKRGKGTPDAGTPLSFTKTRIRRYAESLLKEVRRVCSESPWNMRGVIDNHDLWIDDDGAGHLTVIVPFRSTAYRSNINKQHYSFLPVLMDKGWRNHKYLGPTSPTPTFMSFTGTHELQSVIDKFNKEHAKMGMVASLEYQEEDLGWIPGKYITEF